MKKTTFKKYENFLQACQNESVISNVRQLAKAHSVSVTFTDWLIKKRYLVKLTGGSYKYMASADRHPFIVRLYENRNEPKQAKPEQTGFVYPLSIKCADNTEREKCEKLLNQIGYKYGVGRKIYDGETLIVTNYDGESDKYAAWIYDHDYDMGRHHIDHFNADLIRDIASVRTGDVWVKGEPYIDPTLGYYGYFPAGNMGIYNTAGKSVAKTSYHRPTIAEICDHHGYKLDGMNIVRESEAVESHTSEIVSEMKEIQSESKSLTQREAEVIKLLKSIESDHGVSYSLTRTETTKTVLL